MNSNTSAGGGIGFAGLLGVAFIVLKLTHVITWSWLWVLAPLWIPAVLVVAVLTIVLAIALISTLLGKWLDARRERRDIGQAAVQPPQYRRQWPR